MASSRSRWAALFAAALVIALVAASGCAKKKQETGAPVEDAPTAKAPVATKQAVPAPAAKTGPPSGEAGGAAGKATDGITDGTADEVPSIGEGPSADARKAPSYEGKLAIVVDDFGYRNAATEKILALNEPITCAVLPDGKTTSQDGEDADKAGKLVILHMPMEAIDQSKSNGDGFIKSGMEAGEVRARLHEALRNVPMAQGVSNHMGSRVSTDEAVLSAVLEEVDGLGLFYLDSRTTSATIGPEIARKVGARAYMNSLFLDSVDDVSYVEGKLWEAAQKAKDNGQAVAICHVRETTAKALAKVLPQMAENGIELVFVNELDPIR